MKLPSWLSPYTEPARLRAVWTALAALLASLGLTLSTDLDVAADAVINLVAVVLPLLQGRSTRAAVFSPATFDAATRKEV